MAVRTTPAAVLPDVRPLLVAPDESVRSGHLVDDGMPIAEGVGARMTSLGFAATHVPAGGAQAKVEPTAALLALIGLGLRERGGNVVALRGGAGEPAEDVHAPTVDRPPRADCAMGYAGPAPEVGCPSFHGVGVRRGGAEPCELHPRSPFARASAGGSRAGPDGKARRWHARVVRGPGTGGLGPSSRRTTS